MQKAVVPVTAMICLLLGGCNASDGECWARGEGGGTNPQPGPVGANGAGGYGDTPPPAGREDGSPPPCEEEAAGQYKCTGRTDCNHPDGSAIGCTALASYYYGKSRAEVETQVIRDCEKKLNLGPPGEDRICGKDGWCCGKGTLACTGGDITPAATFTCDGVAWCFAKSGPDSTCMYFKTPVEADNAAKAADYLVSECQRRHGSNFACGQGTVKCK